jgi:hypothetical protein
VGVKVGKGVGVRVGAATTVGGLEVGVSTSHCIILITNALSTHPCIIRIAKMIIRVIISIAPPMMNQMFCPSLIASSLVKISIFGELCN